MKTLVLAITSSALAVLIAAQTAANNLPPAARPKSPARPPRPPAASSTGTSKLAPVRSRKADTTSKSTTRAG